MKYFISYPINPSSTNSIIISTLLWYISLNNKDVLAQVLIDNYSKNNPKNNFVFEDWKSKHIPEIIINPITVDTTMVTSVLEKCSTVSQRTILTCECGFVEVLSNDGKLYDRRKSYNLVSNEECLKCGSKIKPVDVSNLIIPAQKLSEINNFDIVPANISGEILSMLNQVCLQDILVSRIRNTGISVKVFGKIWNIDPDIINIIVLYSSTIGKSINDITFVSSRKSIRKIALYYRIFGIIPNHILIPKINIPKELKNDIENLDGGSILLPLLGSLSWKKNSVFFDTSLYRKVKNMRSEKVLGIINNLTKVKVFSDILKLNRNTIKI